jgi:hypothetical protein
LSPFQGQDGQQYVVLEVIQYPEGQGDGAKTSTSATASTSSITVKTELAAASSSSASTLAEKSKKSDDMANCFGFDDEDEVRGFTEFCNWTAMFSERLIPQNWG